MAIDAMKILGALMNSGALSRGSGSNVLGSILGAVMGGGAPQPPRGGGGLGGMLGRMFGGGRSQPQQMPQGGGLGDILGGLMGGDQGQAAGGGLGAILGAAMKQFGGAQGGGNAHAMRNFGGEIDPQQANDQAMLLVKAMINAAKADGQVDEAEQQRIVQRLGDISQEELDFVRRELAEPLDEDAFIRSIPPGMGQQVYTVSLMAIDLDTNPEARYLDRLAKGVGLSPEVCNQIHDHVGAPRLYT